MSNIKYLGLTQKPGLSTKFRGLNNNITGQNPVYWLRVRNIMSVGIVCVKVGEISTTR